MIKIYIPQVFNSGGWECEDGGILTWFYRALSDTALTICEQGFSTSFVFVTLV